MTLDGEFIQEFPSIAEAARQLNGNYVNIAEYLREPNKRNHAYGYKWKYKKLLIKDLCSRLPYGVKIQHLSSQIPLEILSINLNGVTWVTGDKGYPFEVNWKDCKPYLLPLSNMTEEQKEEFNSYVLFDGIQLSWESFDGVMLSDIVALIDFSIRTILIIVVLLREDQLTTRQVKTFISYAK